MENVRVQGGGEDMNDEMALSRSRAEEVAHMTNSGSRCTN